MKRYHIISLAIMTVFSLASCRRVARAEKPGAAIPINHEVKYEIPQLTANRSQQIIEHFAYTVSYNHDWLIPNWVAYELTNHEASGELPRSKHFLPDPLVLGEPVVTKDYSNSGYDRTPPSVASPNA